MLEPYDPNKIPVLMVHGMLSSPLAWREVTNDIRGNARLRDAFQVWYHVYPTGSPILHSAAELRGSLLDLRRKLDPRGDDPAMQDMVVVGHSLGGILAKTLVQDSGNAVWDALLDKPIGEVEVAAEDREKVRRMLFFERLPFVKRLVFISVPHRGSEFADSIIGKFGANLIAVPRGMVALDDRLRAALGGALRDEAGTGASAVEALSPRNPVRRALCGLPIPASVPFHSIMGDVTGKMGPGGTDGFVDYDSAHLDAAASELVVNCGHRASVEHATVAEVLRILRCHLEARASR